MTQGDGARPGGDGGSGMADAAVAGAVAALALAGLMVVAPSDPLAQGPAPARVAEWGPRDESHGTITTCTTGGCAASERQVYRFERAPGAADFTVTAPDGAVCAPDVRLPGGLRDHDCGPVRVVIGSSPRSADDEVLVPWRGPTGGLDPSVQVTGRSVVVHVHSDRPAEVDDVIWTARGGPAVSAVGHEVLHGEVPYEAVGSTARQDRLWYVPAAGICGQVSRSGGGSSSMAVSPQALLPLLQADAEEGARAIMTIVPSSAAGLAFEGAGGTAEVGRQRFADGWDIAWVVRPGASWREQGRFTAVIDGQRRHSQSL